MVHHGRGVAGNGQKIEVADGLAAAAIAAGRLDLLDGRASRHVGQDLLHEFVGLGPEHPLVGLGGELQACQDRLFGLRAEAFQFADLVGLAGRAQLVERCDLQFAEEHGGPFRPQARHAHHRQHRFRHLLLAAPPAFPTCRSSAGRRSSRPGPCRCLRCRSACGWNRRRFPPSIRAGRGSCGPRCDRRGRGTGSPPGIPGCRRPRIEGVGDFGVGHEHGEPFTCAIRRCPCRAARSRP